MYLKFILAFIFLIPFASCETTPKNEQESFTYEQEKNHVPPEGGSDISNKAAIYAMADIIKPEDEDFSGKAYFTKKENDFTLTVILNNAEKDKYPVYLTKEGGCDKEKINKIALEADSTSDKIGIINVLGDGTGRSEIPLNKFSETEKKNINSYIILVTQTDGNIIGCGEIKRYIEENNLSNAAN